MRWLLFLGLASFVACQSPKPQLITKRPSATPRWPQVTRTQLHVARSLDPESTETMTVKGKNGEVATLIVRKRDGRKVGDIPPPANPDNFVRKNGTVQRSQSAAQLEASTVQDGRSTVQKGSSTAKNGQSSAQNGQTLPRDGKAVQNKQNIAVPPPVVIRSDTIYMQDDTNGKQGRKLEMDKEGILVITGVRVPDDPEDKLYVWRNARVVNGKLMPKEKKADASPIKTAENSKPEVKDVPSKIEWLKMEPITKPIVSAPAEEPVRSWVPPQQTWFVQPLTVVDYSKEENNIRDRLVEYIKSANQQEMVRQTAWSRGSRGLNEPKIEARVLHTPGATVYPTSLLYAPPSSQNKKVVVEEGIRTPVLQYAHPELGVQPATKFQPKLTEEDKIHFNRDQALAYFAHDIHSDRSPYAFEPGLENEARVEVYGESDKRSNSGYSRPKKLSYFYQNQVIGPTEKYYGKPATWKDSYIRYSTVDRRPFWEKIGDSIKEHVEYGVGKVSDLARPVMEPIVEATHKISENLGLAGHGTRELNSFKEKLGVAGSNSMMLPAIGLVAGGAALGLGAVAVGRFLDVDLLKRSAAGQLTAEEMEILAMEHKRAMDAMISGGHLMTSSASERHRRSTEELDGELRLMTSLAASERRRRSTEDELQDVSHWENVGGGLGIAEAAWGSTPCAKRVFCQVMTSRSHDDVTLMEKKMSTYLQMLHPSMATAVNGHLDDVTDAIRRKDCSAFQCPASIHHSS